MSTLVLVVLVLVASVAPTAVAVAVLRRSAAERARQSDLRRLQALALHDNIVQGLARVTWALEASAHEHARAAADATLRDAQAIITALLEEHPDGVRFGPGSLRREGGLEQASNGSGALPLPPMQSVTSPAGSGAHDTEVVP